MRGLSEQTFIVTGGGSGIGRGACERLAEAAANIAVVDCSEENALKVARSLAEAGANAQAYACDVTDEASVAQMVSDVHAQFGSIRGLVTSAGVNLEEDRQPLAEASLEAFKSVIDVNLIGSFLCAKHVVGHLRESRGSIVTVASTAGIRGGQGQGLGYTASKGALVALTQHLASTLGCHGIRVNCLCPGATAGEGMGAFFHSADVESAIKHLIPLQRVGQAEEVGAVAAYLLSDEAAYITGQILAVDGGATTR